MNRYDAASSYEPCETEAASFTPQSKGFDITL